MLFGSKKGWRRGMELNHQIRFCRPFPFRFGFRALLKLLPSEEEGNRNIGKKRHIFYPKVTPGNHKEGTFGRRIARVLADTPASLPHRQKPDLTPSRIQIFSPQSPSVGAPSVPSRRRNAFRQANDDSSAVGPTDSDCLVHFRHSKSREGGEKRPQNRDYARFVHF